MASLDNVPSALDDPRPKPPVFTQKPPVQADYTTTSVDRKGRPVSTFNKAAFDAAQRHFADDQATHRANLQYYRDHELPEWAAREKLRTAPLATASEEAARQQRAQADYQTGPDAKEMTRYKTWAMPAGTFAGGLEGHAFGRGMSGPKTSAGLPEGQSAFQGTIPKRLTMMAPSALIAGLSLAKAYSEYQDANDPNATPYDRDYAKAGENFLIGQGAGNLGASAIHTLKDIGGPNSTSGGRLSPGPTPPVGPVNPPPPRNDYAGMTPTDASKEILRKLGVQPGDKRGENLKALPGAIRAADDATVRDVARGFPGIDASEPDIDAVRGALKAAGVKGGRLMLNKRLMLPLGALGIGAATLGGDEEAQAGQRPGESITQSRLRNFPLGPLDTPANALDTASYWNPITGPARVAADIGTAAGELTRRAIDAPPRSVIEKPVSRTPAFPPKEPSTFGSGEYPEPPMPSDLNLAAARREDARQREELRQRGRTPIGSAAANAVPSRGYTGKEDTGRQSDENYLDDLPDHERGLFEKGASPAETALHYMPYVRAGAEAVKRGESFWGGTPTYERQRRALQTFYNAADQEAKAALGSKAESTPAPPPMEPDLTRARGGVVSRPPNKAVSDILKRYGRMAAR
jgi:hypothetical protein